MIKEKKKGVIVIGGHVQGLGIIRIFGENNIPCILLDSTSLNIAKHSSYCKKFYKYKEGTLLPFLYKIAKKKEYKDWLLIPTNDLHVKILSMNKRDLNKYFFVGTDYWQYVEKCYDKRLTYKIVNQIGVDMPQTWFPKTIDDLSHLDLLFPCIIKPAVMHKFFSKLKKKVLICNNRNELIENYQKAINIIPSNEIIIQEIIPGSNENQYSVCFMYDRNKPLVTLAARRKRQHPLDFGNATTYAETVEDSLLVANATKVLNEIGYKGLCEVEFKKDCRDGIYKFLEINPRTWKWHSIAKKTSSPFLISLFNSCYYKKQIIKNNWKIACWKHIITDLSVLFKLILKKKFNKSKSENLEYAVFDKKDIKPCLFEILYLPFLILKR